jgi:exosortase K
VAEWRQSRRPSLLWWSLVVGVAVALKSHFSAAATTDLGWILLPLTLLLRLLTGWHFELNLSGEWESHEAGIVIVKACAGINFMVLSFLGWCWMLRPRDAVVRRWLEWPVFLGSSLLFAWLCALLVNVLRILAIVHVQPWLEPLLGAEQAHRQLGIAWYLSALCLQLLLAERGQWRRALHIACALYSAMLLLVPLLTGHALREPHDYGTHAAAVLVFIVPLLWLAGRRRPEPGRWRQ